MHNLSCLSSGKKLKTSCCFCLCASQKGGAAVVVGHTTLRLWTDFMGCCYQQMEKKPSNAQLNYLHSLRGRKKKKVQWVKASLSPTVVSLPKQSKSDKPRLLPQAAWRSFPCLGLRRKAREISQVNKKKGANGKGVHSQPWKKEKGVPRTWALHKVAGFFC